MVDGYRFLLDSCTGAKRRTITKANQWCIANSNSPYIIEKACIAVREQVLHVPSLSL